MDKTIDDEFDIHPQWEYKKLPHPLIQIIGGQILNTTCLVPINESLTRRIPSGYKTLSTSIELSLYWAKVFLLFFL